MENYRSLVRSFLGSLLVHVGALGAAMTLPFFVQSQRSIEVIPAFQQGSSSITFTLAPSAPAPIPAEAPMKHEEPVKPSEPEVVPPPAEPEPDSSSEPDEETPTPEPEVAKVVSKSDVPVAEPVPAAVTRPTQEQPVREGPPQRKPTQEAAAAEGPARNSDADLAIKGVQQAIRVASDIRPVYPLGARLRGEEGVVVLDVAVDASGHPKSVTIKKTSGFSALDRAAASAMEKARFVAATRDGVPCEGETTISVRFQLVD